MYLKPKKQLGQHWLHDTETLESIITTAKITSDDTVIEVGPGLGTLTEFILATKAKLIAVEYDNDLFAHLTKESKSLFKEKADNLTIVNQDILSFDFTNLPSNYKVVANIPYYLTSNLVRVLSESVNPPSSVTLLIQKEVAERIAASPGDMSLLGVTAQMYFKPTLAKVVPAKLFTPPPKVDSQVIHLERRQGPYFGDMDHKLLFRIVKAGFSNRRKTLLNSISAGLHLSKEQTKHLLESAEISPTLRAQNLGLDDWIRLATCYNAISSRSS